MKSRRNSPKRTKSDASPPTSNGASGRFVRWCSDHRRRVLLVVASTILLTSFSLYWISNSPNRYVAQLLRKIERSEASEMVDLMEAMIRAGDPGVDATVQALASERPEVREAAKRVIREELDRWRHLENERGSQLVHHLAESLEQEMVKLRPDERDFASVIASEILLWPIQAEGKVRLHVLADCESILRQSMDRPEMIAPVSTNDPEFDEFLRRLKSERIAATENSNPTNELAENNPDPNENQIGIGGSENDVVFSTEQIGRGPEEPSISYMLNRQHGLTPPTIASLPELEVSKPAENSLTPLLAEAQPKRLELDSQTIREMRPIDSEAGLPPENIGTRTREATLIPDPANGIVKAEPQVAPASEPVVLTQLSHIEVMRYLHDQDYAVVKAAEVELVRRRFSAGQIAIGFQITDPNPEIRLAAVRTLREIEAFDSRPWLKWLCRDDVADVRGEAMATIASSPRNEDREFVRELVDREQDPTVRGRFKLR